MTFVAKLKQNYVQKSKAHPPATLESSGKGGGAKFRPADTAEQGSKNALFGPVDKAVGG